MPEPRKGFSRNDDYVQVNERIQQFYQRFPDGRLVTSNVDYVTWGQPGVLATARAYRDAEDRRPGVGTAFEPVPGKTPFTKDSEVQNAETAAWGRAIASLGVAVQRSIATAEDVEARAGAMAPSSAGGSVERNPAHGPTKPPPTNKATAAAAKLKSGEPIALDPHADQRQLLRGLVNDIRVRDEKNAVVVWWDGLKPSGQKALSGDAIAKATERARPILAGLSDVPADVPSVDPATLDEFDRVAK